MTARWRVSATVLLALLVLSYHVPAATQNLRFLQGGANRVALPFALEPFRPVVAGFGLRRRPEGLFVTDRILSIDGKPIMSRTAVARALAETDPEDAMILEVEHYPPASHPWRQIV